MNLSLETGGDAKVRTAPHTRASEALALSGAEIIVRAFERHRVDVVAGIPGGALLPLYEALARCSRIRHILARHEQAAGFIAQGIARLTHRAGVCLATSGPGVTNIITALADAKLDSIPIVCVTGQVPRHLIGTDAFQEVATVELAKPVTKAAFFANSVDELGDLIDEAFRVAEQGRPGPVLIDVPKDVQMQRTKVAAVRKPNAPTDGVCKLPQCAAELDAALRLIAAARRPLLYVGGGVVKSRAEHLVRRLAEQASTPVVTTLMAMGVLPHNHDLNLGMLGMHGSQATHRALDECDLLIAVGARFDDRATGDPKRFATQARIIHVDIDAREFGKIKPPTVSIHCDAWHALTYFVQRVQGPERIEWVTRVRQLQSAERREYDSHHPLQIVRAVGRHAPSDAIVTTDVGQHQMWVAQAFPFVRADRWLTSGGLGTMGFGLPAAIGACIAEPEAKAICFTGDGSLLMNIQELATLAELQLPVKIVLFDNASLGMVRQQQQLFYGRRYYSAHFEKQCDFVGIARAFGMQAFNLDLGGDIPAQLSDAFRTHTPTLIRVPIDASRNVSPMVGPGAANIDAMECD